MGYTRGLSPKEELERSKRDYKTRTRPNKPWGQTKWRGQRVCVICGEYIKEKDGEKAIKHEKKQIRLGIKRKESFWTYRHRKSTKTGECQRVDPKKRKAAKK